jgi:hypothetical protein
MIVYCIQQSKILRKLACFIEEASLDYRLTMVFPRKGKNSAMYQGNNMWLMLGMGISGQFVCTARQTN